MNFENKKNKRLETTSRKGVVFFVFRNLKNLKFGRKIKMKNKKKKIQKRGSFFSFLDRLRTIIEL
jgi:hypothetical protein